MVSLGPLFMNPDAKSSSRLKICVCGRTGTICEGSVNHLLIFTPSHLTSAHVIFSSSPLLIFTSTHNILSSSHLQISSSHLLIFTSSHLHIFTSAHASDVFFLSRLLLYSSLFRPGAVPTRIHEMQHFRTKWGSIVKNCGKIAILRCPLQPFCTKWGSIVKNCGKIAILRCPQQPFCTKWGSSVKNSGKIANCDLSLLLSFHV